DCGKPDRYRVSDRAPSGVLIRLRRYARGRSRTVRADSANTSQSGVIWSPGCMRLPLPENVRGWYRRLPARVALLRCRARFQWRVSILRPPPPRGRRSRTPGREQSAPGRENRRVERHAERPQWPFQTIFYRLFRELYAATPPPAPPTRGRSWGLAAAHPERATWLCRRYRLRRSDRVIIVRADRKNRPRVWPCHRPERCWFHSE